MIAMNVRDIEAEIAKMKENLRAEGRGKGLYALNIYEKPYDWQLKALDSFYKSKMGTGVQAVSRGIVVAPTASGKTLVAYLAMRDLGVPTIVIVPTEPIMWRWYYDLMKRGADVGLIYGAMKYQGQDCDIAIINSIERHPEMLDSYQFVVADEVHHWGGLEFSKLLVKTWGKRFLGLTSTLERMDGRHKLIEAGVDMEEVAKDTAPTWKIPVIFKYSVRQAITDGVVANITIITHGVKLFCGCPSAKYDSWTNTVYGHEEYCEVFQYGEMTAEISKLWAMLHPRDMMELMKMGAPGMRCVSLIAKRKGLLSKAHNKPADVYNIVQENHGEKVLIFSEAIKSIEVAQNYLQKMGVKVGLYHSKLKDWEKKSVFDRWVRGEFDVLMSVHALDEGVDVPECKVGIVIASGSARRQWIQRTGRILRKTGKTAKLYIVYCTGTVEDKFPAQVRKYLAGE